MSLEVEKLKLEIQNIKQSNKYRIIQFAVQQLLYAVILSVCLYNLSVSQENKEIWIGAVCLVLGSLAGKVKKITKRHGGSTSTENLQTLPFTDPISMLYRTSSDNVDSARVNFQGHFPTRSDPHKGVHIPTGTDC